VPDDAVPSPLEDRRLIRAFAAGDERAAETVIREAGPIVQAVVRIVRDAFYQADLTHDVVVKLLERRAKFADIDNVHGYIWRIAVNHALSFLRSRWRFDGGSAEVLEVEDSGPTPEDATRHRELERVVDDYLNTLDDHDRAILDHLLTGATITETREKFGVTQWEVRRIKQDFLAHVSKCLGEGMSNA
jgi:RNA polymerase sigma factor (sigma-70 family)